MKWGEGRERLLYSDEDNAKNDEQADNLPPHTHLEECSSAGDPAARVYCATSSADSLHSGV